ncbi:MAG: sulfotransferase [Phycisphaerales bacterium JB059]
MPPSPAERVLAQASRLLASGRAGEALRALGPLASSKDARVHELTAHAEHALGRHSEAVAAMTKAVALNPASAAMRTRLAYAMQRAGLYEQALDELERARGLSPRHFEAQRLSASVLNDLGRHGEARARVDEIDATFPPSKLSPEQRLALSLTFANTAPKASDPEKAIARVRTALNDSGDMPPEPRSAAWWQIGRLSEKLGRYADAFDAYAQMNALRRTPWDPDAHAADIDRLIETWTYAPPAGRAQIDGSGVILILGMMRSGTSLTEQMLAQLDHVTPGGETNILSRAVASVEPAGGRFRPLPIDPARYTPASIGRLAQRVRQGYASLQPDPGADARVTDKQPYNFYYLPLIARLLPGAKVIHCVRSPMDTCLSCFTQNFAGAHPYTTDLSWLGRYYRDYHRLMEAWKSIAEPDVLDLKYEDTVREPETTLRRVVGFLGLPWDERMLRFHESERAVATSSRQQVRQPLYTSSVNRAQRFGEALAPLREALGDLAPLG